MNPLKRISNLWAWSALEPKGVPQQVIDASLGITSHATIISHMDPIDEIYETIRQENPSQA